MIATRKTTSRNDVGRMLCVERGEKRIMRARKEGSPLMHGAQQTQRTLRGKTRRLRTDLTDLGAKCRSVDSRPNLVRECPGASLPRRRVSQGSRPRRGKAAVTKRPRAAAKRMASQRKKRATLTTTTIPMPHPSPATTTTHRSFLEAAGDSTMSSRTSSRNYPSKTLAYSVAKPGEGAIWTNF
eukprot:Rmarinus@m.15526